MGDYHSEDVIYRAVTSLRLPHTPGPIVLLKTQGFIFHFRLFESKQNVSKDITIIFKYPNETEK